MTEYCTAADVKNRLTERGYQYVVDRNQNGAITAAEVAAAITPAITYAGNLIDGALVGIDPADARGQANAFLRDRAIDIAAYRAGTNGGRAVPVSMKEDYEYAKELIHINPIPGLTYPLPYNNTTGSSAGFPRAFNPSVKR